MSKPARSETVSDSDDDEELNIEEVLAFGGDKVLYLYFLSLTSMHLTVAVMVDLPLLD